ncbi:MAG: TolC family outer membrane protein [Azonexus sp.]|jgi:adhesin transport system outer membrane protein|nr:TolC family outer membrane protein [Azonexus sp.]
MKAIKRLTLPALLAVAMLGHAADGPITLKDAAQSAVLQSPEVTNRWHVYKAAEEEIGVARGGYFPSLDLSAGIGRERLKINPDEPIDYTHRGARLTLTQMLFDGLATPNEVSRLNKALLVRYYELLEASENTALEAARAYLDVLRYRELVRLTEENYVQHKTTYEQVRQRVESGVGRRVDVEQAGSRLALAEFNLTTEVANMHDVSARYQRLVGALPPSAVVVPADLTSLLPANSNAALTGFYRSNPTLLAAIENVEAAQYDINVRRAAYMPRVDLRAWTESSRHYLGDEGHRGYSGGEIVLNWNLFRGGSDVARVRQYTENRNVALDLREKACRDSRQTLLIAYNDVLNLRQRKAQLDVQVPLLEKTMVAYRDQFNIGQRSLLDLLDTVNELFSARRNAVNNETDLSLAYLRTYAGMGHLLQALGLQRLDAPDPEADELAAVNASELCPAEAVDVLTPDWAALNARAGESMKNRGVPPAGTEIPVPPALKPEN